MADKKVTCKTLSGGTTYKHITKIGVGSVRLTVEQAVKAIEDRIDTFYTEVGGKRANVIVVKDGGKKYLRTAPDNTPTDNLLSLSDCVG